MACRSCGQRYRSPRQRPASPVTTQQARKAPASFRNPNMRAVTVATSDPKETQKGIIQPEPTEASIVPAPDYPVEPATGIPESIITTGENPGDTLGETGIGSITVEDCNEHKED